MSLAKHADLAPVPLVAGDNDGENDVVAEAIHRKLDRLRKDVLGPTLTPRERLLAECIGLCWLQLTHAQTLHAQNVKDLPIRLADFHQRRLDRRHHRYRSAMKALAQIRRLALSAIQLNVGQQQVNVASGD